MFVTMEESVLSGPQATTLGRRLHPKGWKSGLWLPQLSPVCVLWQNPRLPPGPQATPAYCSLGPRCPGRPLGLKSFWRSCGQERGLGWNGAGTEGRSLSSRMGSVRWEWTLIRPTWAGQVCSPNASGKAEVKEKAMGVNFPSALPAGPLCFHFVNMAPLPFKLSIPPGL